MYGFPISDFGSLHCAYFQALIVTGVKSSSPGMDPSLQQRLYCTYCCCCCTLLHLLRVMVICSHEKIFIQMHLKRKIFDIALASHSCKRHSLCVARAQSKYRVFIHSCLSSALMTNHFYILHFKENQYNQFAHNLRMI